MSLGQVFETRRRIGRSTSRSIWSLVGAILLSMTQACNGSNGSADGPSQGHEDRDFAYERARMVQLQLESRGIHDERVLSAMRKVLRHRFAPDLDPVKAYEDRPHPIGNAQTISQPYIVALMSELAQVEPPCRVLEIGTGSGYQAAVLAEMGCEVYTIEIIDALADRSREILEAEGYGARVHGRFGDGYRGWPEEAPFDAVVVTAAAPRVPEPLLEQLRVGGRLVIPVGNLWQSLEVHLRTNEGFEREQISDVRFVPMMGEVRE